MRFLFLIVLSVWISPGHAEPVAWDGPGAAGWLTRSSQHFIVHYPKGEDYDALASRSLGGAEQVYSELLPFFSRAPELKTHLVVSDDHDIANGWATFFPYPQIRLYLTPPYELSGLQNFDDWLSLLIRHEYVHILHMELAKQAPAAGQKIFGRLPFFFPHSLTSPMLLEGLAVYLETDYEQGTGRLASSWYRMQMREEVRSGEFDTLGEAVIASRDWPLGKYYLYGAFFTEYLIQTYGEETFQRWLQSYSHELLPWVMQDSVAGRVFGKDFEHLWEDFRQAMEIRFADTEVEQASVEEAKIAVPADHAVRQQISASNGTELIYLAINDEDRPVLRRCDRELHCRDDQTPILGNYTQLSLAGDGGSDGDLAMVRQTLTAGGRLTGDVMIREGGKWQKSTQDMRVARLAWMPADAGLIFSSYRAGRAFLYRLPEADQPVEIWSGEYGDLIGEFSVSPDGNSLVAARKRPGQGWNLEQFYFHTQEWQQLTSDPATESAPWYSPQGDLLFEADYDGRYNIYRWTESGPVALTTSESGAFAPQMLGDRLVYQEYTAGGYVFRSVHTDDLPESEPVVLKSAAADWDVEALDTEMSAASEYRPWSTLRPYYWLPYLEFDDTSSWVGITTGGSDALQRHGYALSLQYDLEDSLLAGTLTYRYQRWLAMLDVDYDKVQVVEGDDDFTHLRDDTLLLQRNYLLRAFEDSLGVHGGLVHQETSITHIESGVELVGADSFARDSIGLAATLSLTGYLLQSPGPGYGSYSHVVYENFDLLPADASGDHLQAGFQYTFDLPGRNGLTLALLGGMASDDAPGFRLGGLPPEEDYSLFGRDQLSLRGYSSGVQRGQYFERERLSLLSEIASYQDNWDIWPLGADSLQLAFYLERGRAWSDSGAAADNKALTGAAAEIRLNLILGYRLRAPLVLGVASPLGNDQGSDEVYGGLQFTF